MVMANFHKNWWETKNVGRIGKTEFHNIKSFSNSTTNLSMVNATRFHVEESKSPQRKSSVFHNRHSISPSNPLLRKKYLSFIVNVTRNSITDTAKSRRLCNKFELRILELGSP